MRLKKISRWFRFLTWGCEPPTTVVRHRVLINCNEEGCNNAQEAWACLRVSDPVPMLTYTNVYFAFVEPGVDWRFNEQTQTATCPEHTSKEKP